MSVGWIYPVWTHKGLEMCQLVRATEYSAVLRKHRVRRPIIYVRCDDVILMEDGSPVLGMRLFQLESLRCPLIQNREMRFTRLYVFVISGDVRKRTYRC